MGSARDGSQLVPSLGQGVTCIPRLPPECVDMATECTCGPSENSRVFQKNQSTGIVYASGPVYIVSSNKLALKFKESYKAIGSPVTVSLCATADKNPSLDGFEYISLFNLSNFDNPQGIRTHVHSAI